MRDADTVPKDGRRRRSQNSRDKIVAAMLDLVAEGHISPSAEGVAARAKVGLRTVFRHFADMESLYAALMHALAAHYVQWLVPFASDEWRAQLAELIERRTATYERLLPFKRAGDAHRHLSPAMRSHHVQLLATMRQRLHALLPSAIADDALRFETLDLLLSFEAWQRLRDEQRLDAATAHKIIVQTVAGLIADTSASIDRRAFGAGMSTI